MEEKKGLFDSMTKGQSFVFGIVGGLLVLCTIGFFVMLGLFLNGGFGNGGGSSAVSKVEEGPKKFSQCLDSGDKAGLVSADMNLGASLGVQGTPATFINGYLISGAYPYEAVKGVIDDLLSGKTPAWDTTKYGELVKVEMPELPDVVWRGNESASVSLVEFSDFECPYCNRFEPTVEQILNEYQTQVKFTYRHFPLSFHQQAQKAAEAFECAKEQGKAFEMHDKLFELSRTSQLSVANYKKAATELGLK